jgi:gamma-glutamylcyclotransferase (GGCT)/AIG2-like uncharacterized protein YtfP
MKTKLYAAYGSNLNLEQMAYRCPHAKVVGKSEIKDYELIFRGWKETAVATIEPKVGNSVPILVWEITEFNEAALDRYEGFPRLYRKENLTVDLDGKPTEVMVYIMNNGYPVELPSCEYFSTIRHGYNSAEFDLDFLNEALKESRRRKNG